MLGKLLKHEFRATARTMLLLYAAVAAAAVLGNLSIRLTDITDSLLLRILFLLIIVLFGAGLVAAVVVTAVLVILRFYRSLLKAPGYLMHTLPVTVHGHIWAKLIVSAVWYAATFVLVWLLILATVFIQSGTDLGAMLAGLPSWIEIVSALESYGVGTGSLALLGAEAAGMVLLGCISMSLHFYAAMSLGHMFDKNKILLSIVFYIAISFVLNFVGAGAEIVVTERVAQLEESGFAEALAVIHAVAGRMLLIQLIRAALLYAATFFPLRYKLNLE